MLHYLIIELNFEYSNATVRNGEHFEDNIEACLMQLCDLTSKAIRREATCNE